MHSSEKNVEKGTGVACTLAPFSYVISHLACGATPETLFHPPFRTYVLARVSRLLLLEFFFLFLPSFKGKILMSLLYCRSPGVVSTRT